MDVFKLVVVGSSNVGKTSLLSTISADRYNRTYDGNPVCVVIDNTLVWISPWDTKGHENYNRLRPLYYPDTELLLLCFSLDCKQSYDDIMTRWYPEVVHYCPDTPIILVGTKLDLREDVEVAEDLKQQTGSELISISDGLRLMSGNPNIVRYMECSSITQTGLREIFEEAARITMQQQKTTTHGQSKNCTLM